MLNINKIEILIEIPDWWVGKNGECYWKNGCWNLSVSFYMSSYLVVWTKDLSKNHADFLTEMHRIQGRIYFIPGQLLPAHQLPSALINVSVHPHMTCWCIQHSRVYLALPLHRLRWPSAKCRKCFQLLKMNAPPISSVFSLYKNAMYFNAITSKRELFKRIYTWNLP